MQWPRDEKMYVVRWKPFQPNPIADLHQDNPAMCCAEELPPGKRASAGCDSGPLDGANTRQSATSHANEKVPGTAEYYAHVSCHLLCEVA